MKRPFVLLLAGLSIATLSIACGDAGLEQVEREDDALVAPDTVLVAAEPGAPASVRASTLTLTFSAPARLEVRNGQQTLVLPGRASRNLARIDSFVPDDAFGEVVVRGPRSFDVTLRGEHEIDSILAGLPLGLRIQTETGAKQRYEAELHLGARFVGATGDTRIRVDEIVPVIAGTPQESLRYRTRVETTATPLAGITVDTLPAGTTVLPRSARRFDVDWTFGAFFPALGAPVTFGATFSSSKGATTARPIVGLRALGLTTTTAEAAWPRTCATTVRSCIARVTKAVSSDFGECGRAREVELCRNEEPPPPPSVTQAEARISADVKAKTGVPFDASVLTLTPDGARTLALVALPRGGAAEFALDKASVDLLRITARPDFMDDFQVARFEKQMPSLGLSGAKIVAHGSPTGSAPVWHFVVQRSGTRSTIAVQATSESTSKLIPFVYDERAFRELAGHLVLEHALALAAQAGVYAELEVILRVSGLLASNAGLALAAAGPESVLTAFGVWGDLAVSVAMHRSTGATRVGHEN